MGGPRPLFVEEVREGHPDQTVEVWFEDEARIGQQGTLTTVWAERGSRPPAVKQTEYDWLYLAGAVNPATGDALGLIQREMNTPVMNDLLDNLGRRAAERNVHVVLVWDNAGFHTSKSLRVPANVTLLPLPPYSPELNPVERIWRHLRQTRLSNKAFADRDHIEREITNACASLTPDTLRSICRTKWIERG